MARGVLLVALVAAVFGQTPPPNSQYFAVNRAPTNDFGALNSGSDQICTAIYTVNLRPEFTTQGNDIGMLQPHGINTSNFGYKYQQYWENPIVPLNTIGYDYTNSPFPTDAAKQAQAKAMFSVTALTDPTGTPIGFKLEIMRMYFSVCVHIKGVQNRWVEIMAQTPQPNRKICYSDWMPDGSGRPNLNANPYQKSCGQGELYACRSSPNEASGATNVVYADNMNIRFYCEDCDDETSTFYWRIVASQDSPINGVQPDAENFCLNRKGTDYPSSLLQPYPADYSPPPVFELSTSSAMSLALSSWVLLALAVVCLVL